MNLKKFPSLQFVIMDQISLLSPLSSNDRSIPLRDQVPENADLLQNHRITGDYLVKP
jgi:hypothetical protein